jgi:hypothetical protein
VPIYFRRASVKLYRAQNLATKDSASASDSDDCYHQVIMSASARRTILHNQKGIVPAIVDLLLNNHLAVVCKGELSIKIHEWKI